MDSLNDRKKAFEKKFAHDAEMTFKAEARRNRMLAEWLGEKWGMSSEEAEKYGVTLIGADLKEAGDDDVMQNRGQGRADGRRRLIAKTVRKGDLPTKDCVVCGRPFSWRKKWAAVWDDVKYCSERCRRARGRSDDRDA